MANDVLHQLDLLDSPEEQSFDDFTVLASRLLNAPVALVSLVDVPGDRQFFKSQVGLPEPVASLRQTPLSHSFCKLVARTGKMLRVIDAQSDPRVKGNPVIEDLGVIAYLGQPLFAPDGTAIGSLCAIDTKAREWTETDADTLLRLSRMANAQIALRNSAQTLTIENDFLDDLLETLTVGVTALDRDGRIIFTNPEACAILGLPDDQLVGQYLHEFAWSSATEKGKAFHASDLPSARILTGATRVRQVVHALTMPDGQRRILSVDAMKSRRSRDDTAVICAIRDITERFNANHKLREAMDVAEAANRAKTAFLANMSHEIRTPLNGVLGLAELLLEQDLSSETTRLVTAIHHSGEALLQVVNAVLDLSQIEAGKLALTPRPIDLCALLKHQHILHAPSALRKGVAFEAPICTILDERIGDDFRIGQIIGNLIGNAVKFTDEGSVTLSVAAIDGDMVEFIVADTGIGMTEEQASRVTEEFEQADSSVTRVYGGSGLGLSIVLKLVNLMDGQFCLHSQPRQGTRAVVRLPLPRGNRALDTGKPLIEQAAPQVAKGLRILVAEDNHTNALILRKMLEGLDARAVYVTDGQAACDAWEKNRFDVLIFDISMPVLDGQGALDEIRKRCTEQGALLPYALAATAHVLKDQTEKYIQGGFDAVLSKPYRKNALVRLLAKVKPL